MAITDIHTTTPTADAAGTWRLGDMTVNRLGFGAMRLAGMPWDPKPRPREDAIAVLRRAVELGVNHIDTAAFYVLPTRSANELISTALQPYPDELVLTTKVGPEMNRDGHLEYARPERLRAQVEENIRQLGRDHMDVVNLRWGGGMDKESGSLADHLGALAELREAGLVRELGVSNVTSEQLDEARSIAPIVCVQNRYGLTDRADDAIVDRCGELGIAFVPFFAVAGAFPGQDQPETGRAELASVAKAHGATAPQVRLAWSLGRGGHVLAIPGTGNPAHLEQNVAAAALELTDDEQALLDAVC